MVKTSIITLLLLTTLRIGAAQTTQGVVATPPTIDWEAEGEITERIPTFAIKTNLLLDALSIANIEVEVPMYRHWSVCAELTFPWWYKPSKQRATEILSGEIQGRYWFDYHTENYPLCGWFMGLYATGGYYDLERRWKGVQGELWGGGLSGGYAHKAWRNLHFEYALGLGIIHSPYDKYNAVRDCKSELKLLRHTKGQYNWWGITKVEVSAVWIFNRIKRDTK